MRLVFLDVIRIYAAFSVYFTHNLGSFSDQYINNNVNSLISIILVFLSNLTKYGGSGVFCFFLVSGYIIHKSILTSSAHVYMIKRFFRIYPAYAIICIASLLLTHTLTSVVFEDFYSLFLQISLLGDFFNLDYGLGGVEWTLRMELYFYIIMYIFRFFDIFNNRFFSLNYVIISFFYIKRGLFRQPDLLLAIFLFIFQLFLSEVVFIKLSIKQKKDSLIFAFVSVYL